MSGKNPEYRLSFTATGIVAAAIEDIKRAASDIWRFEDWVSGHTMGSGFYLVGVGDDTRTLKGLAERLAIAIWKANDRYCRLEIHIASVVEDRVFDEQEYRRMMRE